MFHESATFQSIVDCSEISEEFNVPRLVLGFYKQTA